MKQDKGIGWVLVILVLLAFSGGGGIIGGKPTAVTYIFEKDSTFIPPPVASGLSRLNREKGIVATEIDDDVLDESGSVPEQYRVSIPAARSAGLPALVVMSGDKVRRVVKDPKTEEAVMEAAK